MTASVASARRVRLPVGRSGLVEVTARSLSAVPISGSSSSSLIPFRTSLFP
ncbi:Uncharacterised protein [Mycobacteroides abscessus subsp. abscessus]|nr:Uncharacterised protein [Mycobacteroides abscessus subsp. abscessus]